MYILTLESVIFKKKVSHSIRANNSVLENIIQKKKSLQSFQNLHWSVKTREGTLLTDDSSNFSRCHKVRPILFCSYWVGDFPMNIPLRYFF